SMTFDVLPSITATHEFVVPRSIPMTFPMVLIPFFLRQVGWALTAHLTEPPTIKYSRYCDGEPHIGGGAGPARTGRNLGAPKTPSRARKYRGARPALPGGGTAGGVGGPRVNAKRDPCMACCRDGKAAKAGATDGLNWPTRPIRLDRSGRPDTR